VTPSKEPAGSSASGPQISIRDTLTILFKRRMLIIAFAVPVMILVVAAGLLRSPVYMVKATLLVKARAEIPLAPTESPLIISQVSPKQINSEIEILKSRKLLEEVLEILSVDEVQQQESFVGRSKVAIKNLLGQPQLSPFDEMVLHLQRQLQIRPLQKTNAIQIAYESEDPDWAVRVVQTLTERFLELRAEMYQSPETLSFFEDQMLEAEKRLTETEGALQRFLASEEITMLKGPLGSDSLASQKGIVLESLARLQNERSDAKVEMDGRLQEVTSLRNRLAEEPARLRSSNRFNQDPTTEEIERRLVALELERDALLQDFKPESRFVADIDRQIQLAHERLDDAQAVIGSVNRTEANPVHQELSSELSRAEAELVGTTARLSSLDEQIAEFRLGLEGLNEKAFKLEKYRREAQAAEDAYLLYRKKHEEARISAAMDQKKLINVTVAEPAQRPLKPVSRNLAANTVFGFFFAIAGGLGLAFGTELFLDHTITTADEVERRLGIPHIASIPEEG
jgi:uncharacterized protein involved in exopolysaccharide biosynthesis